MLATANIDGNAFVGVYVAASDRLCVCAPVWGDEFFGILEQSLGVPVVKTTFDGSAILGSLSALNSTGGIFTSFASKSELAAFPPDFRTLRLPTRLNVAGNNILTNDNGALAHPGFSNREIALIQETLGVEVTKGTLGGGLGTVGACAIATNKGVVCHPHTTDEEMGIVADVLGVPSVLGTANFGSPLLGACIVANSKGAVVGDLTTPIEMGRLEDGLFLY